MAKLIFLFALAALVFVASAARVASSDYDKEGLAKNRTILDAATLLKNGTVFPSDVFGDRKDRASSFESWKCNLGWKECMLRVLQVQFTTPQCNQHCNVFIWRLTHDGDKAAMQFSNLQMPTDIFQEILLHLEDGYFRCYMFHSSAYFETAGGWYGFENWGFIGAYSHVTKTNKVTFYGY